MYAVIVTVKPGEQEMSPLIEDRDVLDVCSSTDLADPQTLLAVAPDWGLDQTTP